MDFSGAISISTRGTVGATPRRNGPVTGGPVNNDGSGVGVGMKATFTVAVDDDALVTACDVGVEPAEVGWEAAISSVV